MKHFMLALTIMVLYLLVGLQVVFALFKFLGIIDWSWAKVLIPTFAIFVIMFVITLIGFLVFVCND